MKGWFDAFRDDGGPTLYSFSNRTPVTGDVSIVAVSVLFATVYIAFLVIFPGVRKQVSSVCRFWYEFRLIYVQPFNYTNNSCLQELVPFLVNYLSLGFVGCCLCGVFLILLRGILLTSNWHIQRQKNHCSTKYLEPKQKQNS